MKTKILQITAIDASMNNMLALLNKRTKEIGYEVHCICSPGQGVQTLKDNGYIVHPINIDREISPLKNFKSIFSIYRVLKQIKPDIVHVHTPIASVLGRIAAKLAGVKNIIYTAHGFYFHEGMPNKKYKAFFNIEKYIGRYFTDYIFTQSEEDYELAKQSKFLKKKKAKNYLHISNGIDVEKRFNYKRFNTNVGDNIIKQNNIPPDSLIVTFVGRLVREKGIIDLLEAFKILGDTKKIYLIAMGDIPLSERDKSFSKQLSNMEKNHSNVIFTGRVKNVEDYLYTSDIFVLPSYREGMPRSIIEAMALKNAIIGTNIRGTREEVIDGKTGFLIPVSNPEKLAKKLKVLSEDPKLLTDMKEESYKRACELYNEEKVVAKQVSVFNSLIDGRIEGEGNG